MEYVDLSNKKCYSLISNLLTLLEKMRFITDKENNDISYEDVRQVAEKFG